MGALNPKQALSLDGKVNPFGSPSALRFSNYCAVLNGSLVRVLDRRDPSPRAKIVDNAMRAFILSDRFSCVAAKGAVTSGGYRFGYYRGFASCSTIQGLARDLNAFVAERASMQARYATFVAVFEEGACGDERWFEAMLWRKLQRLHKLDARYYPWDPNVSNDPSAPNFGFSFAGQAFFVVGMHGQSSRVSRRFPLPALAFNAHSQFEDARRTGHFYRIQRCVRDREVQLEGSINPELAEFGTRTEARQYSGRRTAETWKCPFQPHS